MNDYRKGKGKSDGGKGGGDWNQNQNQSKGYGGKGASNWNDNWNNGKGNGKGYGGGWNNNQNQNRGYGKGNGKGYGKSNGMNWLDDDPETGGGNAWGVSNELYVMTSIEPPKPPGFEIPQYNFYTSLECDDDDSNEWPQVDVQKDGSESKKKFGKIVKEVFILSLNLHFVF